MALGAFVGVVALLPTLEEGRSQEEDRRGGVRRRTREEESGGGPERRSQEEESRGGPERRRTGVRRRTRVIVIFSI